MDWHYAVRNNYHWCGISEPLPVSDEFEEELSQFNGDLLIDDKTSCREVEEGSYVEQEFSEEDSSRILTNQSSSKESGQKIDAAEAAERERLWKEEIKAYYDR